MRPRGYLLLALALVTPVAFGQSTSPIEELIVEQIRQSWQEASKGNYDAVAEIDFGLTKIGESRFVDYTVAVAASDGSLWDISTATEQARLLNEDDFMLHATPRDIHVMFLGAAKDVVYVSYYLIGTIAISADDVQDYRTRVSQVLERKDAKWVIRGAHYSGLMGASGIPPRNQ